MSKLPTEVAIILWTRGEQSYYIPCYLFDYDPVGIDPELQPVFVVFASMFQSFLQLLHSRRSLTFYMAHDSRGSVHIRERVGVLVDLFCVLHGHDKDGEGMRARLGSLWYCVTV